MSKAKVAVARRTEGEDAVSREGPVLVSTLAPEFKACLSAAVAYSEGVAGHFRAKPREDLAAFARGGVEGGHIVLQPWVLEILFVLGTVRRARFTEMQRLLGVSSRTLSDKLQMLRDAGFVDREVFDEQPVRIEYFPTRQGLRTAALATPLICELNRARDR